jgi:hypothetical protein
VHPRRDPETAPAASGPVQFERRPGRDKYGNPSLSRWSKGIRTRPVEVRNGYPFRPYVYRGTGRDEHPETGRWTLDPRREREEAGR